MMSMGRGGKQWSPWRHPDSGRRSTSFREWSATGRRGLEAGRQLRAVAIFGIAGAKGLDLCAVALEPPACLTEHLGSRAAAPHRVLGEGALAEEDAGMTSPDGQVLPLAVCGQERPVLCL